MCPDEVIEEKEHGPVDLTEGDEKTEHRVTEVDGLHCSFELCETCTQSEHCILQTWTQISETFITCPQALCAVEKA